MNLLLFHFIRNGSSKKPEVERTEAEKREAEKREAEKTVGK